MSLQLRNTRELLSVDNLKLKMLVYGPSGTGKTLFCSTAPNPVIAACETGHGNGLMTLAATGATFCTPSSYEEMDLFCSGQGLDAYETVVIDGFSYLTDSIVKDKALAIPRAQGNSPKRQAGVLELDDYGTLAEYERRLLAKVLALDKHVIVTCLMDYYQPPSANPPKPEKFGGPDLPGSMRNGSTAMFDVVMRLSSTPALKDPKDPKSRFYKRTFLTENDGQYLAKSRLRNGTKPLFPSEVVFNYETGDGSFKWFLETARSNYATLSK